MVFIKTTMVYFSSLTIVLFMITCSKRKTLWMWKKGLIFRII